MKATGQVPTPAPAIDVAAERLDEPVVLIPLRLWVGLAALVVILGGFAAWGMWGTWSRQLTEDAVVAQHRGAPAAAVFITDRDDLAKLSLGDPVVLDGPSGTVVGHISGVDAVPVTRAALADRWGMPLSGLPTDAGPVWTVHVRLAPRQVVYVAGSATATVELPSLRPYQLVFGSGQ